MAHGHSGCQSPRDYFTEQLLTILVCGALAFVGIQMYLNDMLKHILAPQFHIAVLIGSIAVLVLVAVRAVSVWREAGELQPLTDDMNCQENHVHSASCNHLPGLPDGSATDPDVVDDGHSHDMSWMFARMLILVFPIALFALGVPNSGFSKGNQLDRVGKETALDPKVIEAMAKDPTTVESKPAELQTDGSTVRELLTEKGLKIREIYRPGTETKYVVIPGNGTEMSFNLLTEAALDADKRKAYEGQTAIMQGRFKRLGDKEFTLFRLKMTCCGPDAVTLKVRIVTPYALPVKVGPNDTNGFNDFDWVQVKGVVQFIQVPGQNRYTPMLVLPEMTDLTHEVVKNEYEF